MLPLTKRSYFARALMQDCSQNHFIAITKAYETLSDAEKRKKFDLFGDIEEQVQQASICSQLVPLI